MPNVSRGSQSFSCLTWTFQFLQVNTQRPTYGMLDHSPVHFRDQHKVAQHDKS